MGTNLSHIDQQRLITAVNDLHISNQTDQSLSTNDHLISSFLEIAVGHTVETAREYLETTNWNIEEAIHLFLMNNNSDFPIYYHENQVAAQRSEETSNDSDSILSSSFLPPSDFLFEGYFENAKYVSSEKNRWLIVNLQSRTEFDSHTLNRDVWSNEAVSRTVESSFILWQVYDDTIEGQKISSYYKIESSPPVVFVIDPITGQKMRMWSGAIEPHSLVEDLMNFTEAGPHEHIASLTRNKPSNETCQSSYQAAAPSWGEEFEEEDPYSYYGEELEEEDTYSSGNSEDHVADPSSDGEFEEEVSPEKEETCSSSNHTDRVVAPSWGSEFEEEDEETCLEFPDLTEEPKADCDRSELCSLCVRFPDGRRKQRKFLKTEPIQLLWSFCYSHMEESERKVFKLVQAIPSAYKTLDYEANETFEQSGLANSMISVTWE